MRAAKDKRPGEKTMYNEKDIYGIAGKYVSQFGRFFSKEDQEDMKQEIAIAMWKASHKAKEGENPEAYLCKTGKGTALNTVRRMARYHDRQKTTLNVRPFDSEEDSSEVVDFIAGEDSGYVQTTIETERASAIESAIASLPTVQATIVRRTLQEGATLETAGKEQGFSKQRAKQVLNDAKETLALRLQEWEATVY
jgi:RNA polymerase sigma factor (sigma-70 family)